MISPRAFAEMHGVAYTTVLFWLKNDLLAGAAKERLPFGKDKFMYQIPAEAPKPELTPGPAPRDKTEQGSKTTKTSKNAKKGSDQ